MSSRKYFDNDKACTVINLRNLLIEHIDDKRLAFNESTAPHHSSRKKTFLMAIDRKFIAIDRGCTVITDLGRFALAELLADYTEALVQVHLAQIERLAYSVTYTSRGTAHYGPLSAEDEDRIIDTLTPEMAGRYADEMVDRESDPVQTEPA